MAESEHRSDDDSREHREPPDRRERETADGPVGWVTESALRIGLAIVGFILLMFALGQAVGADLIGLVADVLDTQMGRWLTVAVFALLLIYLAVRGFGTDDD